jgi:uncharacterized membrane protein YeaQ/YmgE (transglycosylase-associated protein family)
MRRFSCKDYISPDHHIFDGSYISEENMGLDSLIVFLIIGGVAGWLAGLLVKGFGFGIIGNIIVGIVGAVIAGYVLPMVGLYIGGGIIGSIINATIGAVLLLLLIKLIKRA